MFLREFLVLEANKLSIIFISMGLMPVPTLMKQPLGDCCQSQQVNIDKYLH